MLAQVRVYSKWQQFAHRDSSALVMNWQNLCFGIKADELAKSLFWYH
jgi:hypothetical protein